MHKPAKSEKLLPLLRERLSAMNNGAIFPSVRQLMKEYSVSQLTVTSAIAELKAEGLLESIVGKGTVICHGGKIVPLRIAALFPAWPSEAMHDAVEKLQSEAAERAIGIETTFYDIGNNIYKRLNEIDADAIILNPPDPGNIEPDELQYLLNCQRPVVMIRSSIPNRYINYVCCNNQLSGMMAANYLHRKGHHRLGLLFSEPHYSPSNELAESFLRCAKGNGAEVTVIDCKVHHGELSPERTYIHMKEYLAANKPDFTALFALSDETVPPVMKALQETGISVPGQLSIMSFGNTPNSRTLYPALTTIDPNRTEIISTALNIIAQWHANGDQEGCHVNVYPAVIERSSVLDINSITTARAAQ